MQKREVPEETGLEVEHLTLIDINEHVFTYNGIVEHEIVFVYSGEFTDKEAPLNDIKE